MLGKVGQRPHPDQVTAPEVVAEAPMQQVRQLRRARFQSFQEESGTRELVLIRRLRKQLQTLFVGGGSLSGIETEVKAGKGFQIRERHVDAQQVSFARGV